MSQGTSDQTDTDQHGVVLQVHQRHAGSVSIQVAKIRVVRNIHRLAAVKCHPKTPTFTWTGKVTQQLIVILGTLSIRVVTHVVRVHTDGGVTTAVVTRKGVVITVRFIFVSWTVVHLVAAQIDRQTEERCGEWTQEVMVHW
ncbi:hypothetical protein ACOMHN_044756 [Nucella lapillus]